MKYIYQRVYPKLPMLNRISSFLSQDISSLIYKQTIFPIMDYGSMTGLRLLILGNHKRFLRSILSFTIVYNISCPDELVDYLIRISCMHDRNLRDKTLLHLSKVKTKTGQQLFSILQQQIGIVLTIIIIIIIIIITV